MLSADDGLHDGFALSGGGPGELEAGVGSARRCSEGACSPSRRVPRRRAPRTGVHRATFRLFNGEWDKVQVVETAAAQRTLGYEQRSIADIAAC